MKKLVILAGVAIIGLTGCTKSGEPHLEGFKREDIKLDNVLNHEVPTLDGGYELMWSDEFDYQGAPNSNYWGYDTGFMGLNDESQYYTDSRENSNVDDGKLTITAKRQTKDNAEFTSARMVTKGKVDFTYGKVEVRAKLPGQHGMWPAIWLLPDGANSWPDCGEIDIMEWVSSHGDETSYAIHTNKNNHTIPGSGVGGHFDNPTFDSEFHTYGLEWTADKLTFSMDDQKKTVTKEYLVRGLSEDEYWRAWPFDKDFHIILNVAVGGWGGQPNADFVEDEMVVDYVRVYQNKTVDSDKEAPTKAVIKPAFTRIGSELKIDFNASTDNNAIKQYDILVDGKQVGATLNTTYTIKNLDFYKSYKINVLALDWNGNYSISNTLVIPSNELNKTGVINLEAMMDSENIIGIGSADKFSVTYQENGKAEYDIYADTAKEYTVSMSIKVFADTSTIKINVNGTEVIVEQLDKINTYTTLTFDTKITLKEGSNEIIIMGLGEGNLFNINKIEIK